MNCTAIAYEWILAPPDSEGVDFTLVLASCQASLSPGSIPSYEHHIYHAQFPPADELLRLTDVSGVLGLLWHATDKAAERKADAFERIVADAIVWCLRGLEFPEKEPQADRKSVV